MSVFVGYERVVEGRTYIGELSGQPKKKENVFVLLKSIVAVLRSKFGKVHVNLGRPIDLDELLQRHNPHWRAEPSEGEGSRARGVSHPTSQPALRIKMGNKLATPGTTLNFGAMALFVTPRAGLPAADLVVSVL